MIRAIRAGAVLCALALSGGTACSGAVNETAATMTYNARYVGLGSLQGNSPTADPLAQPLAAEATLSQLTSTVTGTITLVTQAARPDTVLRAGVTGRTTGTGVDVTVVQPAGCAMRLAGALTLASDGSSLAGTLVGSDCHAAGGDNVRLVLSLSRQ